MPVAPAESLVLSTEPPTPGNWRLIRIAADVIAGGTIAVHLATMGVVNDVVNDLVKDVVDTDDPPGEVEVEISCGAWRRSFPGTLRERRALAGGETEWIVEVDLRRPGIGLSLLRLATLGDVRHMRAGIRCAASNPGPTPTRSAA